MHPDKKVGMALGILLVGIVGAFFFRNDTEGTEQDDNRKLASAEELDERIRTGTQVPYLPNRDEDSQSDLLDVPGVNIAELIEEIPNVDLPETGSEEPVVIPEPIRIGKPGPAHDLVSPIPSPGSKRHGAEAAKGPGILAPIPKPDQPNPASKATAQIHEVIAGETLSGIASKYLGTHRRYQELFEANRDLLKSPNAIRVGMKLKIPPPAVDSGVPVPPESRPLSGPVESPTVKVPETSTPKAPAVAPERKETAKPQFVRPSGVVPRISSKPGRSLGQRPPPGLPRVEGLDTVAARRRTPVKAALRNTDSSAESKQ